MGESEEVEGGYYTSSLQHILAELERIDLLVRVQVWRARQVQSADGEFQGLYISEQEVDDLLAGPAGLPRWAAAPTPLALAELQAALDRMADEIARRKAKSARQGITLRLDKLAHLFQLTPFDVDVLLIGLAPELDLRYERLYAYLQDDVTKKRPSVDLVLNLLSPSFEAKLATRERFAPTAFLFRHHLLHLFDDPSHQQPPLLSRYLKVDERVVGYLLDSDVIDGHLLPYTRYISPQTTRLEDLLLPDDFKRRLSLLAQENRSRLLYFQGSYGVGKQTTAEALCQELGVGLLVVDGEQLLGTEGVAFETIARLASREALLQNAALYWDGFDGLLTDERQGWRDVLIRVLEERQGLTFLSGDATWEPADALQALPFVRVEFSHPAYAERVGLWEFALGEDGVDLNVEALANKFRLSGGQIQDAAVTARNLAHWRAPENGHVTMADLYAACRLQSNRKLATLAQKITPHYAWDDIVLPPDPMEQLREICNYVKYRALVYEEWGFDRKLSLGKGLNALFAGPSGTGKTMAAEIIADELGLDLYKIDLSGVVSKYIGETEKNLARIFAEAETSNAILFFDEADALFGKRSEVRDAHDRYANIEIGYLLQKMEEYEGVVILATNLRKNMDDAFVRRMHFTVEFPFPNEKDRRRIWEKIWPEDTPRSPYLDLDFMACRIEVAGGNIRNIALAAAFLAADDGAVIDMRHLVHATQREYQKMGKVVVDGEFGEYAGHVRRKAH
ncbi:MAG: ATP-binding protein [Anaerolineae bacterium]|nr:ATP-binding protein [Anaerolineae bacterium]